MDRQMSEQINKPILILDEFLYYKVNKLIKLYSFPFKFKMNGWNYFFYFHMLQ